MKALLDKIQILVHYDAEAKVYWADSDHIRGLVVEAKTKEKLRKEAKAAVEMLLEEKYGNNVPFIPALEFIDDHTC